MCIRDSSLSVPEAQMLMQLMAEQGDPRSPALAQRQPRQAASACLLYTSRCV